ncbi:MAG: hypothetical protein HZA49_03160 [Planctomycetes bacterium]|nr:hypothetical protein [Planctomycetota bacterium]
MITETRTDEELMVAYKSGEIKVFERLDERYRERLTWFAKEKVNDFQDAQDASQMTLTKSWQNLDNIENTRKLSSYLYRVCTNECYNIQRERSRNRFILISQMVRAGEDDSDLLWFEVEDKDSEWHCGGAYEDVAESMAMLFRILAVLNGEEHRLWYCFVSRGRKYIAINQDEALFRAKTENDLRAIFGQAWRKVWEQRNKEVAKWVPKTGHKGLGIGD